MPVLDKGVISMGLAAIVTIGCATADSRDSIDATAPGTGQVVQGLVPRGGPPAGIIAQSVDLGPIPQDPRIIGRDGGMSAGWQGKSLWAFADTFTTVGDHFARNTLTTTTDMNAADGINLAPPSGAEFQDAAGNPEQFTPFSQWENWFNYWNDPVRCGDPELVGGDCGKQFFHWPSALVADAAHNRLIAFFFIATTVGKKPEGCKDDDPGTRCPSVLDWGWSVAVLPAGQTTWQRPEVVGATSFDRWTLFFANEFIAGNPIVVGDDLHVTSCRQDFVIRHCSLARVPIAQMMDRSAWRFHTGNDSSGNPQWSTSVAAMAPIVDIGLLWSSVHFNTHLGKYVMVSGQLGNDTFYSTAPKLWGPWSDMGLLFHQVLPAPPPPSCSTLGNYAVQVHPEYGSGNTIYISYLRTKSWPAQGCGGLLFGTPEFRLHKIVFGNDWAATWGSGAGLRSGETGFAQQTLRQIVPTSVGGSSVRVKIRNAGTAALQVDHATIAVSSDTAGSHAAAVQPATLRTLTFAASNSVSIPPGQTMVSDVVSLAVPADHRLAISLYFPGPTGPPTGHSWSGETISYLATGDLVNDAAGTSFATAAASSSYYVTGIDVIPAARARSVIVLGDSLSDGTWIIGRDSRQLWSNVLLDRLRAGGRSDVGVVNMALGGNAANPHALARFDTDVALQSGARTVFMLLGWNDILGFSRTPSQIIADLQALIDRGHNAGLRVVGATLPPFGAPSPSTVCQYPPGSPPEAVNADQEAKRLAVNAAIRPGGSLTFDAIADFDAALRDPAAPERIQCQYAGNFFGWRAHPGAAGHQAMADAINLTTLVP